MKLEILRVDGSKVEKRPIRTAKTDTQFNVELDDGGSFVMLFTVAHGCPQVIIRPVKGQQLGITVYGNDGRYDGRHDFDASRVELGVNPEQVKKQE